MTAKRPPHNFLPAEYDRTAQPRINHNYLSQQFADYRDIFEKLAELVEANDFTLGRTVDRFERAIAALLRAKHVIGVGSGTDALFLSLKALGVGPGDEVITTPYTFHSTVGAIGTTGARPVFADIGDDYNLDPAAIESMVTVQASESWEALRLSPMTSKKPSGTTKVRVLASMARMSSR